MSRRRPPRALGFALLLATGAVIGCPTTSDCPDGTVADGDTCVPEACGVGTWGDLPVDGETVHVDLAADPGGDGSADAPLTSIQAGLDRAGDQGGGLVAVAAGTYAEALVLDHGHAGVHLAGRCQELVTLDASQREEPGAITIDAAEDDILGLEGLTVTGGKPPPYPFPQATHSGVAVIGGWLQASRLEVTGNGSVGIGVSGASARLGAEAVTVHHNAASGAQVSAGVWVDDRARASLLDCSVTDEPAFGLAVVTGGAVEIAGGGISRNGHHGIGVDGSGSSASLEGVSVDENGYVGTYVTGGELRAESCSFHGNRVAGIIVRSEGSSAVLQDVAITDTRPDELGSWGLGVWAYDHASLTMQDVLVRGSHRKGIGVLQHSTAELHDVRVEDTRRDGECTAAVGLTLQDHSTVVATHLEVRDTEGPGVFLRTDGDLRCSGCTLQDNSFAGVVVNRGSALWLQEDSRIEGTHPDPEHGGGVGVYQENRQYPSHLLQIEDSTIGPHPLAAVWLQGPTGSGGAYVLRGNTLHGGAQVEVLPGVWSHGDILFATDQVDPHEAHVDPDQPGLGLLIEDNLLVGASGAAVFLDGSSATLAGNTYQDNAVDLWQQRCEETEAVEGAEETPAWEDCPAQARPNLSLYFDQWLQEPGLE